MPGPFIPVWALSRSQAVRIGNRATGAGSHVAPMLTKNPSTAALPTPLLVDLSDGASRRDLAHHLAIGSVIAAHGLRLTNSLAANTVTSTTVETIINQVFVPANALSVGSTVRATAQGVITATTCTARARVRVGPLGTVADQTVADLTSASATNIGYIYDALISTQAIGAGTAGKLMWNAQIGTHSTAPTISANVAQVGIDTTVGNWITFTVLSSVSAGVTTTNSLLEVLDQAY